MKKGFTLIAIIIITSILLGLGVFFISFSITDVRIARAHAATICAYYLAETATELLIHKIKTDDNLRSAFINGTLNENNSVLELSNVLQNNDHFYAYATSTANGEAVITTQSNAPLGSAFATRTIKTNINRALGGALKDYTMFTSGTNPNMTIRMNMAFDGGIVFGGQDIKIYDNSTVTVNNGSVWAHHEIKKSSGSSLIVTGGAIREDVPTLQLPAVDFNSSHPNSWRNQATTIMSASQFDGLPNGTTLEGIIFVEGSHYLRKNLTVRGLLVINGNFEVEQAGNLVIIANNGPSGLLVKQTLELETLTAIEGIVYAGAKFEIEYDDNDTPGPLNISITGGIMAGEIMINRDRAGPTNIIITHNDELIERVMNVEFNLNSPTINVGHWEEKY